MDIDSNEIQLDVSWTTAQDRSTTNIGLIGEMIRRSLPFARNAGQELYYYHKGIYKPGGEVLVGELYIKWLRECMKLTDWKPRKGAEITEYITLQSPYLWDRPPLYRINLLNGIYDWEQGVFLPHSPDHLTITQIPIMYDPNASCPEWEKFLGEVLPYEGGINYLIDVIGICMTPFTGLQKCIVLVGEGSNGKSTYLNALQSAIGLQNICNIPLHTLTNNQDRFSRAGLVGKLVNVFGDMSARRIEDAANFKPLVGEDRIPIEAKHKQPYYYIPFCKLIFSCNEIVKSDDDTVGYKRRFIHIPFTQRFDVDPQKGLDLKDTLASPMELSGLFNHIIKRLPVLVEKGFTTTPEIASIIDDWCPIPEDTRAWLTSTIKADPNGYVPSSMLYTYYTKECPSNEVFDRGKFISYLKNLFPGIKPHVVVRLGKKTVRCHRGISMVCPTTQTILETESMGEIGIADNLAII